MVEVVVVGMEDNTIAALGYEDFTDTTVPSWYHTESSEPLYHDTSW